MANDVIYPNGVILSDAEHTALASLGLHAENGVAKTDVEPLVTETRDAQAAVAEAERADTAPTQAELDSRTEQSPGWDGSERRSGTDRRVIDAEYDGEDRRVAESDRRAEPPAKTEVDETVTEQPAAETVASVGPAEDAPQTVTPEQQAAQDGQRVNEDGNIESAFPVGETIPAQEPQSETAPADENLNPPIPATQVEVEPTVPGTPPNIAAHGQSAAEPSPEPQPLKPADPQA